MKLRDLASTTPDDDYDNAQCLGAVNRGVRLFRAHLRLDFAVYHAYFSVGHK